MPGLQKQLVPVPLGGLQTKVDPKGAPVGLLTTAENVFATRRAGRGVEMRKRLGFTSLTKSIQGGGSIAAGRSLAAFGGELVVCDALASYSYSATLAKWILRGRTQSIAADLALISGNEGTAKVNADVAYSDGYACYVSSPNNSSSASTVTKIYVRDIASGEVIAATSYPASVYRCRVLALSSAFYIFSWNGSGKVQCQKIATATPTTFGALTDVATNVHTIGLFDVCVDVTNSRMLVAYRNTTPTLTIGIWTTGMAAGTTVAYASIDPDGCIGFLNHDFANGSGYVAVGRQAPEIRALTFSASTMVVATNLLIDGSGTASETTGNIARQITGYKSAGGINVLWTLPNGATTGHHAQIRAYAGATATVFTPMASVGLASRPFKIGAKWYVLAGYQTDPIFSTVRQGGQQRMLMLEIDEDSPGTSGTINIAGYLMASNSAGGPASISCLPSVAAISSTRVLAAAVGIASIAANGYVASQQHYTLHSISLDWSGAGLGRPVTFAGVMHIPGAAAKVFDGHFVYEDGFYMNPEAPETLTEGTAGSLVDAGVYEYCLVYARTDKANRLTRSAPGPVATITLGAGKTKCTLNAPTLRVTDCASRYNANPEVLKSTIEIYRTQNGLPNFYLCGVVDNSVSVDTITFVDTMSDSDLIANELLYTTGGVLDHVNPPAVKAFHRHAGRLFAVTGDDSIWHTKTTVDGEGALFSDDLRFTIDDGQGSPTAMGTVDSTAVIFKRNRTYLVSGPGPDEFGNNEFPAPQPLNIDAGATGPGAVTEISTGLLVRNPKDWYTLSRSLEMQPVEAPAAFSANVPAFGTQLDGYPIVVIPTQAEALVYDWQLGQWYDWTGASSYLAGVMSARYGTALAILQSDGTVKVQGAAYNDDSAAIAMKVEGAWINLTRARLYKVITTADWLATTTLSETISYDFDSATAATKTIAVTTGTKGPVVMQPNRGRASVVKLLVQESSTTAGVALTGLDLEVGIKSGAEKHRAGQYMT